MKFIFALATLSLLIGIIIGFLYLHRSEIVFDKKTNDYYLLSLAFRIAALVLCAFGLISRFFGWI